MKTLLGEANEISSTEKKANETALRKAKKWVDQRQ